MKHVVVDQYRNLEPTQVDSDLAKGAVVRRLLGPDTGWSDYVMRIFTVSPGGHTPRHSHDWPHINLVVAGTGQLLAGEDWFDIEPGTYAFVPPNLEHQYRNTGSVPLEFMCIIPQEGEGK